MKRLTVLAALALVGAAPVQQAPASLDRTPRGYQDVYASKKRLLVIADLSTGNQIAHSGVSHAAAVIEQIGRASGAYVTFIRTDTDLITKGEVWGKFDYAKGGPKASRTRNLDYYDAVLFYTNGETNLSDAQKADLLTFIREGKGFIGVHTATATAYGWPEYHEMLGGTFDNHPWNIADAKIIVERADFPAMKKFRTGMSVNDEHYQMRMDRFFARDKIDVLARLDPASVDLKAPMVHRIDQDFPVAWIKTYGKGRVFYSGLGHTDASWDDPRVRTMYLEGIKWTLGVGGTVPRPHPIPAK